MDGNKNNRFFVLFSTICIELCVCAAMNGMNVMRDIYVDIRMVKAREGDGEWLNVSVVRMWWENIFIIVFFIILLFLCRYHEFLLSFVLFLQIFFFVSILWCVYLLLYTHCALDVCKTLLPHSNSALRTYTIQLVHTSHLWTKL